MRMSYRYLPAGKNGFGWQIRFCWSTRRNDQGYFQGWRETAQPRKNRKAGKVVIKRSLYAKSKNKKTMVELARKRLAAARGPELARIFAGVDPR